MKLEEFYNEEYSNSKSILKLKKRKKISNKALFLDRDGILIEDVHHIDSPNKVRLCPNIINFLKESRYKGFDLIVITNQSSVSRSIISYKQYKLITARFLSFLTEDLYPDLILSSFHLPNNENNLKDFNWRKPGTGMLDYVFKKYNYKKSNCAILGDKLTDLKAGYNCGLNKILHNNQKLIIKNWSIKNNIKYRQIIELDTKFL